MYFATAPTPAACATGDWAHKLSCGWHEPTTAAANAGQSAAPWVLLALIMLAVLVIAKLVSRRSGSPAPSKP